MKTEKEVDMGIAKPIPQIAELRKPQFHNLDGRAYLRIPILNEDKNDKDIGADYVIEFPIGSKGPSGRGKVIYQAPGLGKPTPVILKRAGRQAQAVWKRKSALKIPEKVGANT